MSLSENGQTNAKIRIFLTSVWLSRNEIFENHILNRALEHLRGLMNYFIKNITNYL